MHPMISLFGNYIKNKKLLILGYGREGRSSYHFIRTFFPDIFPGIADKNPNPAGGIPAEVRAEHLFLGDNYLDAISRFDVILKSPGVQLNHEVKDFKNKIWLSQTGLFLEQYHRQVIGVTGTKGKSTTASLIHHLHAKAGKKSVLVGNIGLPPFDLLNEIDDKTTIVFELSANQLEDVRHAPHIGVLLNLFPEHLDYFGSTERYFKAKMNIVEHQVKGDVLIYDAENEDLAGLLGQMCLLQELRPLPSPGSSETNSGTAHFLLEVQSANRHLKGQHNLKNLFAAALACLDAGLSKKEIVNGVETFLPLEHRLEYAGCFCGIDFYNDSISTIPESTIEAVKTISNIQTLILGGFDRGISYSRMLQFLAGSKVERFIFTGPAGKRMMGEFNGMKGKKQQCHYVDRFEEMSALMMETAKGHACVLSPAASSYDQFTNFEERGRVFKKMAENLKGSCQ
jgi:UDP-N-acetylmuramoyl-L-alanine---L-glutamate ligase